MSTNEGQANLRERRTPATGRLALAAIAIALFAIMMTACESQPENKNTAAAGNRNSQPAANANQSAASATANSNQAATTPTNQKN
ncbi:MAG TPA: hypothetical protein VJZ26_10305, partial [Blastocatellia bacterium]|nr:hypothetical protein [Blastocatellia bacterium]